MPKDNELHLAAQQGNLVQVHSHINKYDINAKGGNDETALLKAAEKGHLEVVQLLLGFNPDVNLPNEYGITALIRAAHFGHAAVVKALLKVPSLDINHATVSIRLLLISSHLSERMYVYVFKVRSTHLHPNPPSPSQYPGMKTHLPFNPTTMFPPR